MLTFPSLLRRRPRAEPGDVVVDLTDSAVAEPLPPTAQPGWFSRGFGVLQLGAGSGASWRSSVSAVAATVWLLGWVLIVALLLTLASGWIGGGPLLRPDSFVDAIRLLHLMPVSAEAGSISLLPMLPALLVLALMVHASRWLLRRLLGGVRPMLALGGIAGMAGAYTVCVLLIATSATTGSNPEPLLHGGSALLMMTLVGIGLPTAAAFLAPRYPRGWLLVRAAGTIISVLLALGFLLLMLQLFLQWSRFWELGAELLTSGIQPASQFDAAALGAIQLAYLPNAVVWTLAYLLGAGFSVGTETIVSPFSVTLGTLPQLPLTALIPTEPLRVPWWPLLLGCGASLLAGAVVRNAGLARRMGGRLAAGLSMTLLASVGIAVLAAASAGGLGPGRLAFVGPSAGITFVAALLVVGVGQVLWALFPALVADVGPFVSHAHHRLRQWRRPRLPRVGRPRWRRGPSSIEQ